MLFYLQIQEWLCLNCQTQRAISGQLGDMGKMPSTPSGPKASPMPVPTEQPPQKIAMPAQDKVKKKEQEVKTEAEKIIPEKAKETPLIEKMPPRITTDQKQEESKQEKDKALAPQEKKPPPEDKKTLPEEKKPPLEEKKPTPEDKKLPPGPKTSALEEQQKHDLLKTQVQIAEGKPEGTVASQAVQEKKQPQTKVEDLPSRMPQSFPERDDGTTQKIKEQPQAACTAQPGQVEPGKEKTVSYVFLTLHSLMYVIYKFLLKYMECLVVIICEIVQLMAFSEKCNSCLLKLRTVVF